ncbi:VOC family protein [Paenibacillus mesotrionivorans]|uniref:VOC family protein n=1 Tax=Paenibacillus mesotrionivorans TaxID=3160968 RepID=A0ACC7NUA5_9BACL
MGILRDTHAIFILFVKDQGKSRSFYRELLGIEPSLDVPGMTEFAISETARLGLMPEEGISRILEGRIPHPQHAGGAPRSEVYLYVEQPDAYYDRLEAAGGRQVSAGAVRNWGDYVAYGTDPDGHLVAFAEKRE